MSDVVYQISDVECRTFDVVCQNSDVECHTCDRVLSDI